jgi:chaperonin GroES
MKIKPLHDWVVIRTVESEERTAGGIFIPEAAQEKPQWGIVESVGSGIYEPERKKHPKGKKKFIAAELKAGDQVLYERYAAREFTVNHEKVVMVRESSVLGTLESGHTSTALQTRGPGALEKKGPSALQKKEPGAVATVKRPAGTKKTAKK